MCKLLDYLLYSKGNKTFNQSVRREIACKGWILPASWCITIRTLSICMNYGKKSGIQIC